MKKLLLTYFVLLLASFDAVPFDSFSNEITESISLFDATTDIHEVAATTSMPGATINITPAAEKPNLVSYDYQKLDNLGVVKPSATFSLKANKTSIYVEDYQDYHVAHFSFSGTKTMELTASETINSYTISPKSYGITATINGSKLTFNVTSGQVKPRYLIIQVNSLEKMVILADELETDVPNSTGTGIFNITEAPYNADDTWTTDVTSIIQTAIDDASAYGGGTVYVPAGAYLVKDQIAMKSNMNLYLEGGAVIKSSTNLNDIGLIEGSSWKMTESMFMYDKVQNVKIYGRGIVDASGTDLMDWQTKEYRRKILDCTAAPKENLTFEGIVVKNGTTWTVNVRNTTNPQVKNVKVINHKDALTCKIQNDGINLCSSNNGTVDGCFVMTVDDAMCSKAQLDGIPTYNLTFKNNVTYNYCAANKSGMQARGPHYNILWKNNDAVATRRGIVVESTQGTYTTRDITFEDCRVEEFITAGFTKRAIQFTAKEGDLKNIIVTRCEFDGNSLGTSPVIEAIGNKSIDRVTFTDLVMDGTLITNSAQGNISIDGATNVTFFSDTVISSVHDSFGASQISKYYLSQNYPNPVLTFANIEYTIPKESLVTLKVYDLLGKELATLVNENKQKGQHEIEFNRKNLSSGTYLYTIHAGDFVQTKKIVLK